LSSDAVEAPARRDWGADREVSLRLWIALARCYATFAREVASRVGEYGLTTPQFGVLEALYHLGSLTLGDLADKLLVTGGNITYVMDRLERRGLVTRERCHEDRRVVWANLSPAGRRLIEDVFPDHVDFIHGLAQPLEEEERAELRRLLKKLGRSVADGSE
jgi:MarR family 2-MHQ and catechol resistance regulon transcriptional repressor